MRQAGYLAAAGSYALDHHRERLVEDHQKARELGAALEQMDIVQKVEPIETNIVIFELNVALISEQEFLQRLTKAEIAIIGMGQGKLRMVTHLDYTNAMHSKVLEVLQAF